MPTAVAAGGGGRRSNGTLESSIEDTSAPMGQHIAQPPAEHESVRSLLSYPTGQSQLARDDLNQKQLPGTQQSEPKMSDVYAFS